MFTKFNIFGVASCFIIYVSNPFIIGRLELIPSNIQTILVITMLMVHITDNIISYNIILNLKQVSKEIKDNTLEIFEKVKNIIYSKSTLYRRLVDAFPNIKEKVQYKKWNIREKIENLKKKSLEY